MSTTEKFKQLLRKLQPNVWQYKADIYSVERGDTSIRMYPQDGRFYVAMFKGEKELWKASIFSWANPDLYDHLQDCIEAAIEREAIMIEEAMDEFASVIFGVGDRKLIDTTDVPCFTFEIDECVPVE